MSDDKGMLGLGLDPSSATWRYIHLESYPTTSGGARCGEETRSASGLGNGGTNIRSLYFSFGTGYWRQETYI